MLRFKLRPRSAQRLGTEHALALARQQGAGALEIAGLKPNVKSVRRRARRFLITSGLPHGKHHRAAKHDANQGEHPEQLDIEADHISPSLTPFARTERVGYNEGVPQIYEEGNVDVRIIRGDEFPQVHCYDNRLGELEIEVVVDLWLLLPINYGEEVRDYPSPAFVIEAMQSVIGHSVPLWIAWEQISRDLGFS